MNQNNSDRSTIISINQQSQQFQSNQNQVSTNYFDYYNQILPQMDYLIKKIKPQFEDTLQKFIKQFKYVFLQEKEKINKSQVQVTFGQIKKIFNNLKDTVCQLVQPNQLQKRYILFKQHNDYMKYYKQINSFKQKGGFENVMTYYQKQKERYKKTIQEYQERYKKTIQEYQERIDQRDQIIHNYVDKFLSNLNEPKKNKALSFETQKNLSYQELIQKAYEYENMILDILVFLKTANSKIEPSKNRTNYNYISYLKCFLYPKVFLNIFLERGLISKEQVKNVILNRQKYKKSY